jgi:hypothetical protein
MSETGRRPRSATRIANCRSLPVVVDLGSRYPPQIGPDSNLVERDVHEDLPRAFCNWAVKDQMQSAASFASNVKAQVWLIILRKSWHLS